MNLDKLTDASILVKGKVDGFEVELTGLVEDVEIFETPDDEELMESWYDLDPLRVITTPKEYYFKGKFKANPDNQEQYRVKLHPKKVKKSATMEYTDGETHPVYVISKYRALAGAPEGCTWRYNREDNTMTITWEEEKYE